MGFFFFFKVFWQSVKNLLEFPRRVSRERRDMRREEKCLGGSLSLSLGFEYNEQMWGRFFEESRNYFLFYFLFLPLTSDPDADTMSPCFLLLFFIYSLFITFFCKFKGNCAIYIFENIFNTFYYNAFI